MEQWTKSIDILLVDDHKTLTDGLEVLLSSSGYRNIHSANSFEKACELICTLGSGILILDYNLNGRNGLDVLNVVHSNGSEFRTIILTSYNDIHLIRDSMKSGCYGFVNKQSASDYIINSLDEVRQGREYFCPTTQAMVNRDFTGKSTSDMIDKEIKIIDMLSKREIEVLRLIGEQYTSEEIAKTLYLSKGTIDTYRKNLIQKLHVRNSIGLALFAKVNNLIK